MGASKSLDRDATEVEGGLGFAHRTSMEQITSVIEGPLGAPREYLPRTGRDLMLATKRFADDIPRKSWWFLFSTLALLAGALAAAGLMRAWPLRLSASVLAGLLMVRVFILYHDYIHGAILRHSRVAKIVLYICGILLLAPPSSWRKNHNLHHTHMGKLGHSQAGGFPLMTVAQWHAASRWQRLGYRTSRHPLTILGAAFTIFFLSMTLVPFLEDRRRHWDSIPALLLHVACVAALWGWGGFGTAFFVFVLPFGIAAALGAYVFFVQHNFVGMKMLTEAEWTAEKAALLASSHLDLGPIMSWFTGEIGYHHVHHLNRTIPFYRLPEAMQALPELQGVAAITTLAPRDILACLRLSLWDESAGRMVSYGEAASRAHPPHTHSQ